jgi:hypothetical protein
VCHRIHGLCEAVASSFEDVKAQYLPFPDKGTKGEEMIDWIVGEVSMELELFLVC